MAPSKRPNNATPGRRKKTDNQYFDVGILGRKTGITLHDTGIRDEYGLEPVSGIFSSPASPTQDGEYTLTSETGMDVQESSAPEVTTTLTGRKTPRFPPPRQSTPKHTNIGSPKRMSSVKQSHPLPENNDAYDEDGGEEQSTETQPRVNRKLEYGTTNQNRTSLAMHDTQSPFKPRRALRRSTGPARPDPYALPEDDDHTQGSNQEDNDVELSIEQDYTPPMLGGDDHYSYEPDQFINEPGDIQEVTVSDSPLKRKRGRPRKSDQSLNSSQIHVTSPGPSDSSSGKKRSRASLANGVVEESSNSASKSSMGPPSKKKRTSNANKVIVHRDEDSVVMDRSDVAHGDQYNVDDDAVFPPQDSELAAQLDSQLEATDSQPEKKGKGRANGKRGKAKAVPKERDPNRAMSKGTGSPVKLTDSPSRKHRGASSGPVSNVNLRATTPFDDANQQTSRFGRNLIQPLMWWKNEARIWKGGVIEGIVRAEQVETPKLKNNKKRRGGRKPGPSRLHDIEEESEAESTMPDEWEEEIGVISGTVANWNRNSEVTKTGDSEDPITEDLAFAASSIITRDVAGSDFKYAKIMTMPFFGAGVVEIPPEGFKRAKNSRKMQMAFFVHEGKVVVEVGATEMEVNSFALSKGGVWVVPRVCPGMTAYSSLGFLSGLEMEKVRTSAFFDGAI